MSTLLNDFPCIHHIDLVCVLDGRKASVALSLALPLTGNNSSCLISVNG